MKILQGKKVAILVADGFEQVELTGPREALVEAGAQIDIVAPAHDGHTVRAWNKENWGENFPVNVELEIVQAESYDALLIPGGVMSPDKLKVEKSAVDFVKRFFALAKPVAAICHGPWLLIDADALRGRVLTSHRALERDIKNAGAYWIDKDVVVDHGLVTSRGPEDLPAFQVKMIQEFAQQPHLEVPAYLFRRSEPRTLVDF